VTHTERQWVTASMAGALGVAVLTALAGHYARARAGADRDWARQLGRGPVGRRGQPGGLVASSPTDGSLQSS
jgi:hypothetical protein